MKDSVQYAVAHAIKAASSMHESRYIERSESGDDERLGELLGYPSWSMGDDENDVYKDLTACDKECGYCGRCPY